MAVVEKEVEASEGITAVVVNGAAQMGSDEFMIPPDYLVSRNYLISYTFFRVTLVVADKFC